MIFLKNLLIVVNKYLNRTIEVKNRTFLRLVINRVHSVVLWAFFIALKEELNYMKTTIEELIFLESIKTKLKMKASQGNLKEEYINGHMIKFNETNLNIMCKW